MKGSADYRGPGDDFPYMGFQILGATHLLLGIAMEVVGIVRLSMSEEERLYTLHTGGVAVWCPMAAIATGILGVLISKKRYWEVRCLKEAFVGMCLITGMVFMVALGVVTGIVDFYQYNILKQFGVDFKPEGIIDTKPMNANDTQMAIVWLIMALAALELMVCMVSACVCCCCAPLYREDTSTPQQQIVVKQEPPPPVYVEKPAPAPAKTIYIERPAPQPQPQQQQQIVLRAPVNPQPIVVQAKPTPKPTPVIIQQAAPQPQQQQVIYQQLPPPRPVVMAPRPMMMAPRPMMMGAPQQPGPFFMRPPQPAPIYASMRGMPQRMM